MRGGRKSDELRTFKRSKKMHLGGGGGAISSSHLDCDTDDALDHALSESENTLLFRAKVRLSYVMTTKTKNVARRNINLLRKPISKQRYHIIARPCL